MKKLIALFAVTTMASTAAVAGVALSGSASVTYDDNGTAASATSYDADLTVVGTGGSSTLTASFDLDSRTNHDGGTGDPDDGPHTTAVDLATTIGPVTVAADMFNVNESNDDDGGGDYVSDALEPNDTSVSVTLDIPVGDATIGLNDSGDLTFSGTFSGVTVTHTGGGVDKTVGSASIAGMDITVTNDAGATTWSLATTISGVDITLADDQAMSAAFGLAGNTMTVTRVAKVDSAANTQTKYSVTAVDAYTTVAVSRDLTSGATLTATYSDKDDSLTLKAAVTF
jgi:hypothetical protein